MRVSELSKELGVPHKDLIAAVLEEWGIAKSHSNSLTVEQIRSLRAKFGAQPAAPAPVETAPAPEPVAAPVPVVEPVPEPVAEVPAPAPASGKRHVTVKNPIIVREFADALGIKPNQIIAEMMRINVFASINQRIDFKVAVSIAEKHGCKIEYERKVEEKKPAPPPPKPKEKKPLPQAATDAVAARPPVVAFMGHVDHGKTSLLDRIRSAKVAAGESGGITQHIGAYTAKMNKKEITFLDTPGHEAFTAMRARGANLTDIVVLVVDAVDGVMPQTREAIQHAKAAGVTIMVAINKCDLRASNPDRVKQQLQGEGLMPEDWGGDVVCCPVSALTGQGIDQFLELILLQAEMLELKANAAAPARGYVVEAQLASGMGPTATLLVREGTLRVGDVVLCGTAWGRVKALIDHTGARVKEAPPSHAVKCLGMSEVPVAGAEFTVATSERDARAIAENLAMEQKQKSLEGGASTGRKMSLDDLLRQTDSGPSKVLNMVLKCDVQGSLEALQYALGGIKSDKVSLKILYAAVGNITVNDVLLASASNAIVVGFHVSKDQEVNAAAKREGVEIRLYSIIYELVDEVKAAMAGMLEPILREHVLGSAEVRQLFDLGKKGKVAGCLCKGGKITSRARCRVKRRGEVLYVGAVVTLRRYQNEASEVREGQECGIRLDNFGDFQAGDILEMFEVEKLLPQL